MFLSSFDLFDKNIKVKDKIKSYTFNTFLGLMMMEYLLRGLLSIHGVILIKQGISYISNPRNNVFESLLIKEGLAGPGLDIAIPFLGIAYFSVGLINVLAGLIFRTSEANSILISTGFVFHIGMALVRSNLNPRTYIWYKPGMISKTNSMQFEIGIFLIFIGLIEYF